MAFQLLKGKKGIISGALDKHSIAWQVALRAKEEGAQFILTNAPVAQKLGNLEELSALCDAPIVYADATHIPDIENLYQKTREHFGGGIDFLLHSIGMSPNIRKKKTYGDLNYDWYMKSIDVSALSLHKLLQTAEKHDILNEWASVVGLSYIAAQRIFPFYTDMADAKAMLESIARGYGYRYGKHKKVRVNTVSQSPTRTTAGTGIGEFDTFFELADQISPLGNASAEDCANYILTLFSDLTRMVTMQNLFHDGGYSFTAQAGSIDIILAVGPNQTPGTYHGGTRAGTSINLIELNPTSTKDMAPKNFIKVYPNPTNSILNIECSEISDNAILKIMSVDGKIIKEVTVENVQNHVLDVSFLTNGTYLLMVQNSNWNSYFTFIKE